MSKRIGVIAGSFDPITNGHTWLIERALSVVYHLYVVVGNNPSKKYMFTEGERAGSVASVMCGVSQGDADWTVTTLHNQMLIDYVAGLGAQWLIRGIRNPQDFQYEHTMQLVHQRRQPAVETIFFIPPVGLAEVSSSTVKSLVGYDDWEKTVSLYVDPIIVQMLKNKEQS